MPLSCAVLLGKRDPSKLFSVPFGLLNLLSNSTLRYRFVNGRFHFQCDLQNMVKYFSNKSLCLNFTSLTRYDEKPDFLT